MLSIRALALVLAVGSVAACGKNVGEQLGVGAAGGAAAAAVANGNPLTGAAIGAAGNVAYCSQYPSRC